MKTFLSLLFFLSILSGCTFTLPSLTMTLTPTSSQRQMVGESRELEKDGWVISSVRTSATGSSIWEKEVLDSEIPERELDDETYLSLRTLAYFSRELREYKKKGFVGEGQNGEAKVNPLMKETLYAKEFPKSKSRVEDFLKILNASRKTVYGKRLNLLSKEKLNEAEMNKKKSQLILAYFNLVEEGEYFESRIGKWSRKD